MSLERIVGAFALLFSDTCTVYEYRDTRRSDGSTGSELIKTAEGIPCRLSYDNIKRVYQTDTVGHSMQTVRLFTGADVEILPGSVVEVTRGSKVIRYNSSGIPAIYRTHRELLLEPASTQA